MRAHAKDLGISLNFVQRAVRNDFNGPSREKVRLLALREEHYGPSEACTFRQDHLLFG